jgi:prepilin-type N-terminal cleavage/methylation domain-containing protein
MTVRSAATSRSRERSAFTFLEVITAIVLAGVLALVAVAGYNWIAADTRTKLVRLDAKEFERAVRSLANTELRSPTPTDASTIADQMTRDEEALSIAAAGSGYQLTRNGVSACVVLGDGVNSPGTVTDGECP